EKLYNKYKDKVRFDFTHFASYVTLSAIVTECAGRQDKLWEIHDSLMHRKFLPDTAEIFDLAKKIKLNMVRFKKDFTDFDLQSKIEYNFRLLKAYGLYATPTILINGKPIFNSSSEQEIEKKIKEELKK
ncbi:MAG: thioredoxin domain-containing protein, partial [Bacteroidia bacterium]|nr:thioredoxin domain-containing protein [Bacteroidia bacterium]